MQVKQNGAGTNVKIFGVEMTVHDKKQSYVIIAITGFILFYLISAGSGFVLPKILNSKAIDKNYDTVHAEDFEDFKCKTDDQFKNIDREISEIKIGIATDVGEINTSIANTNGSVKELKAGQDAIVRAINNLKE